MTGYQLKAARTTLGYTQATLAKALHVSPSSIARWEMNSNQGQFPIPRYVDTIIALWLKGNR